MKALPFLTGITLLAAGLPASAQGHPGPQTPTQAPAPAPAPPAPTYQDGGRGVGHDRFGPGGHVGGAGSTQDHPRGPAAVRGNVGGHPTIGHRTLDGGSAGMIQPRHRARATAMPDAVFWQRRDIMAEIQAMARRGPLHVTPVGADVKELEDYAPTPSGWKAYGFVVPPKGTLHVRLYHTNTGWFRLMMGNKWGQMEAGMLQNLIPTGNPEVSYTNPTDEARAVYVIADDPGWMSSKKNPYKLVIERGGEPAKPGEPGPKPAVAIPPHE